MAKEEKNLINRVYNKNTLNNKRTIKMSSFTKDEWELIKKWAPTVIFDKNEPFFPKFVGVSILFKPQYPASLLYYRIKNNLSFKDRFKRWAEEWVLTLYHTPINDRKPFKLKKFHRNRPQPVLMEIEINGKKISAHKVIEYAFYYDSDIEHIYDLEHVWVYLNRENELLGIKATRHGIFVQQYESPEDVKFYKGHPRLFATPGKHSFVSKLELVNRRILLHVFDKRPASQGIYPVQFFNKEDWNRILPHSPGDKIIKEYYKKHYSKPPPAFKFVKTYIPSENELIPWMKLMSIIPDRMINWLEKIKSESNYKKSHF